MARRLGIEGARKLFVHYGHERSQRLSKDAKKAYLTQHGKLACEVCGTEPMKKYGLEIIEAHHKIPLSSTDGQRETTFADFMMLCPNCHRAVHKIPDCSITVLRSCIDKRRRE